MLNSKSVNTGVFVVCCYFVCAVSSLFRSINKSLPHAFPGLGVRLLAAHCSLTVSALSKSEETGERFITWAVLEDLRLLQGHKPSPNKYTHELCHRPLQAREEVSMFHFKLLFALRVIFLVAGLRAPLSGLRVSVFVVSAWQICRESHTVLQCSILNALWLLLIIRFFTIYISLYCTSVWMLCWSFVFWLS